MLLFDEMLVELAVIYEAIEMLVAPVQAKAARKKDLMRCHGMLTV